MHEAFSSGPQFFSSNSLCSKPKQFSFSLSLKCDLLPVFPLQRLTTTYQVAQTGNLALSSPLFSPVILGGSSWLRSSLSPSPSQPWFVSASLSDNFSNSCVSFLLGHLVFSLVSCQKESYLVPCTFPTSLSAIPPPTLYAPPSHVQPPMLPHAFILPCLRTRWLLCLDVLSLASACSSTS